MASKIRIAPPADRISLALLTLLLLTHSSFAKPKPSPSPWSSEKAWQWFRGTPPIRGVDYEPSTAVNDTDIWQAESFDPITIDRELTWAHDAGYNNIRVFLQYLVWEHNPKNFKKRLREFLSIADKHGIKMMPVLFDDCAFSDKEPYLGKQADPVPGVHNSQWVPSPGHTRVTNQADWPKLEKYVKDIVSSFRNDRRILIWDLYNEPGNAGMGKKSLPLLEAAFTWARAAGPTQPLTAGVWSEVSDAVSQRMLQLSDVITFHGYDPPEGTKARIEAFLPQKRPLLCTEWLHRQDGNTFANILPIFADNNIGWYNACLVAGKTQSYMHWNSLPGTPAPQVWQHCVFRSDGKPYDAEEIQLISAWKPASVDHH